MMQYLRQRRRLALLVCSFALLLSTASTIGAYDKLRIKGPEQRLKADQPAPLFVGFFRVDDESGYTPQSISAPIRHAHGRSVAYLAAVPLGTDLIETKFFPMQNVPQDAVGFALAAGVRYRIDGRMVYVVTAEPSPKALEYELMLGDRQVDLGSGRIGYTSKQGGREKSDKSSRKEYNGVVFAHEGMIVMVYSSDLPTNKLAEFASTVTLVK